MTYDSDFFDLVFCLDIFHHVDIPKTLAECRRVLKPGGRLVGDEFYTHSTIERIFRRNALVQEILYTRMVKFIYGSECPYITADEHKIDEHEFARITGMLSDCRVKYFNFLTGRLIPEKFTVMAQMDRMMIGTLAGAGKFVAGCVIFEGTVD